MRTLKLTMMVALALALGAANANASSIDIIWDGTNSGTTGITGGAHTGTIVLTVGSGDTGIGGVGAGIGLSAESTGGALLAGSTAAAPTGWLDLGSTSATSNPLSSVVLSFGDLFGSGASIAPGASIVIGTITVTDDGNAGTARISSATLGDDILSSTGNSVLSEFTFGGGNIVPEPTTASLLGLGLLGLSIAGRNRKN